MHRNNGFSLVELSIVLVILGLLVGGVMSGQSLIRAAELRSVTTAIDKYTAAIYTFQDKYFALPGDMPNATRFWTAGASCPTDTTGGTCDGNGNGVLVTAPYSGSEMTYSTQHLALAGLIEGVYDPNWPAADPLPQGPYAYPLKLDQLSLTFSYRSGPSSTHYDNFGGHHYLWLSKLATTGYHTGYKDPGVKCEEAWQLDKKLDDGKPGTGRMVTIRYQCTTDSDAANYSQAEYALQSSGTAMVALRFD